MRGAHLLPGAATVCVLLACAPAAGAATITARGAGAMSGYAADSSSRLVVTVPAGAQAGDLVLATLGYRRTAGTPQAPLSPPTGWTLVTRANQGAQTALAVYRHVLASGESSFAFTTNLQVGGTAVATAYGGADPAQPI